MKTTEKTLAPKHYHAITDRSEKIQKQVLHELDPRLIEVCAVVDKAADLAARFGSLSESLEPARRERLEASLYTARASLRDAGVAVHLLTLGHLSASISMLRESAESLCLAYLVKHEPTAAVLGRKLDPGVASRALHRNHHLGPDQEIADRLYALIDRLKDALVAERRVFLGSHFDRNRMPEYYLQLENIKRVSEQLVDFLKELLLVETAK